MTLTPDRVSLYLETIGVQVQQKATLLASDIVGLVSDHKVKKQSYKRVLTHLLLVFRQILGKILTVYLHCSERGAFPYSLLLESKSILSGYFCQSAV